MAPRKRSYRVKKEIPDSRVLRLPRYPTPYGYAPGPLVPFGAESDEESSDCDLGSLSPDPEYPEMEPYVPPPPSRLQLRQAAEMAVLSRVIPPQMYSKHKHVLEWCSFHDISADEVLEWQNIATEKCLDYERSFSSIFVEVEVPRVRSRGRSCLAFAKQVWFEYPVAGSQPTEGFCAKYRVPYWWFRTKASALSVLRQACTLLVRMNYVLMRLGGSPVSAWREGSFLAWNSVPRVLRSSAKEYRRVMRLLV
jgi:hypothetical protein